MQLPSPLAAKPPVIPSPSPEPDPPPTLNMKRMVSARTHAAVSMFAHLSGHMPGASNSPPVSSNYLAPTKASASRAALNTGVAPVPEVKVWQGDAEVETVTASEKWSDVLKRIKRQAQLRRVARMTTLQNRQHERTAAAKIIQVSAPWFGLCLQVTNHCLGTGGGRMWTAFF